jgi:hypothetical protein
MEFVAMARKTQLTLRPPAERVLRRSFLSLDTAPPPTTPAQAVTWTRAFVTDWLEAHLTPPIDQQKPIPGLLLADTMLEGMLGKIAQTLSSSPPLKFDRDDFIDGKALINQVKEEKQNKTIQQFINIICGSARKACH